MALTHVRNVNLLIVLWASVCGILLLVQVPHTEVECSRKDDNTAREAAADRIARDEERSGNIESVKTTCKP
jgi:hypothetical protein